MSTTVEKSPVSKESLPGHEGVNITNLKKFLSELQVVNRKKFEFNHFDDTENKITFLDVMSSSFRKKENELYTDFCERVFEVKKGTKEFEWLFSGLWKYTNNSLDATIFRFEYYIDMICICGKELPEYFSGFEKSPFRPGWSDKFEY